MWCQLFIATIIAAIKDPKIRLVTGYWSLESGIEGNLVDRMTTTTGDPSSLKTPASLSGGDLVSRLLAATPPYLYNVPLTPHSFFFSEMLRSFVQSKADASTSGTSNATGSVVRRRKRSWRDARERPLELTTKEKPQSNSNANNGVHHLPHHSHHHHHHHHNHQHQQGQQQQKDKYYAMQQAQTQQAQQRASPPEVVHPENRFKSHHNGVPEETSHYGNDSTGIKRTPSYERRTSPYTINEPLKPMDENHRPDFCKQARDFYDDSSRRFSTEQSAHRDALFAAATLKVKPEESPAQQQQMIPGEAKNRAESPDGTALAEERAKMAAQDSSFLAEQKNKLQEFAGRNFLPGLPGLDEQSKTFGLSGVNVPNSTDFLPSGPLWYPPYPAMPQSYPGIDPLHFFIDLRVSGHIWDRKINERQLPFKSKHCSAFSVPQAKEYNRPLDLTRDEATTSSNSHGNSGPGNQRGTHFILRHLCDTYKDIRDMENMANTAETISSSNASSPDENTKDCQGKSLPKSDISACSSSSRESRHQKDEENEGKDLRALIGLELVVDYVKEPKENVTVDEEQSPDVGE